MKQKRWVSYLFSANERMDRLFFRCVCVGTAFVLLWVAFTGLFPETASRIYPGCPIYRATGVYCPGCGGTHAFHALVHGQVEKSLRFHPAVLPTAAFIAVYLLRMLIWKLSGGRAYKPRFRRVYPVILLLLAVYHVVSANVSAAAGHPLY